MAFSIGKIGQAGSFIGTLWKWFWSYKLYVIFFAFIFFNTVITGIQTHQSFNNIFIDSVKQLVNPLNQLQDVSLQVIHQGGFYNTAKTTLGNIFSFLNIAWTLFFALYGLFLWLKLLSIFWMKVVIQDDSKSTGAWLSAIITYPLLLSVYLGLIGENMLLPIEVFKNFIKAIPYFVKPIAEIGQKYTKIRTGLFN